MGAETPAEPGACHGTPWQAPLLFGGALRRTHRPGRTARPPSRGFSLPRPFLFRPRRNKLIKRVRSIERERIRKRPEAGRRRQLFHRSGYPRDHAGGREAYNVGYRLQATGGEKFHVDARPQRMQIAPRSSQRIAEEAEEDSL
jgi:hypothetical protein